MENSSKTKKRKKGVSCIGALLILCMLVISICTLSVNLLFRGDKVPKIGSKMFYFNSSNEVAAVPQNSFVILEKASDVPANSIVLYSSTAGNYKIGKVSLVLESASTVEGIQSEPLYYLTNDVVAESVAVMDDNIVGICKTRSSAIGAVMHFMLDKVGIFIGLIIPCIILLLYIMAIAAMAKEAAADDEDDDDTDLAFVKSIQEKKKIQQTITLSTNAVKAAADAAAENSAASENNKGAKSFKKFTPEEIAAMEEQEAAERAERIAAIRSRMENRQQTEMPDNVPLFTTEFIAKTHTMSIPKAATAAAMANSAAKQPQKKEQSAAEAFQNVGEQVFDTEKKSAEKKQPEKPSTDKKDAAAQPKKNNDTNIVEEIVAEAAAHKAENKEAEPDAPRKYDPKKLASASFEELMALLDDEESKL